MKNVGNNFGKIQPAVQLLQFRNVGVFQDISWKIVWSRLPSNVLLQCFASVAAVSANGGLVDFDAVLS